ncbi:MAG: prolyl oligopeptidase family serine peptidase, partial [Promethearchaeota archaeon]
ILPEDSFALGAKFSPDDSWIAVPIDYTGREEHSLYRLSTESPERPIPREKLSKNTGRHLFLDWSPDGAELVWTVSRKEDNMVVIQPNEPGSNETILWKGKEIAAYVFWTHPDYVKFTQIFGKKYSEIVMNPKTGEEVISIPIAQSLSFVGRWHPQKPIFPFMEEEDYSLSLYDVQSNDRVTLPQLDGEIEDTAWSFDGNQLFAGVTKNGRDAIYCINIEGQEANPLPLPEGVNKVVKVREWDSEESLFFIHSDATTRVNLWRLGLKSGKVEQVTKKRSPKIGTDDFPLVNSISEWWKSRDGLQIHGFVMSPQTPPPPGGFPAIVYVHGGPEGQDIDTFVGLFQILAQEGFVVFRPNFRGSTGYGPEFQRSNYRQIGKADLLDIVTGVEKLIKDYNVNAEKVGITGGSYGGYMTLRALTKPDVFDFAAGWAEAAISDFQYQHDHGDALFKEYVSYLFGPMEDDETKAAIKEASPIWSWEKVRKPLGVVQFAADTRTPLKPVWDFVNFLIDRGDEVEFHVEAAMGHANIPKGYLVRSIARRIQFFQKILLEEK